MPPRGLSAEVMLSIELDAICSRNRYTSDPAPVIAELAAAASTRTDILAESVGTWVGFFGGDEYVGVLAAALREVPGVERWITVGEHRRSIPHHRTPAPKPGHGM
ncbi:hypothetical protein [Microbacterium sp. NPDC089696]|uniref:hypothetical protein n=1 Tax=Microbacterium sp. NPDC089696 TaxID=3364199 RepID=UPI00381BE9D2